MQSYREGNGTGPSGGRGKKLKGKQKWQGKEKRNVRRKTGVVQKK